MTRVTVDAATRARLHNLDETIVFCDEEGRTLGYFQPGDPPTATTVEKITSPFSDAEIEEMSKQRTGRPLADILRDLGAS